MGSSCSHDRNTSLIYILKNDHRGSLRFFTISSQLYVEGFIVRNKTDLGTDI